MSEAPIDSALKFDPSRAGEYDRQSRIALAGYDACHELTACMLSSTLGSGAPAQILVAGVGTGQEILSIAPFEPLWHFTAVDPAAPMMEVAKTRLAEANLTERTTLHLGYVEDLPEDARFDAATLIGVLHHLPGDAAKKKILSSLASRLKPGGAFVLAGNCFSYQSHPRLLKAWRQRWIMQGASAEAADAKLAKILAGADPPHSEEAIAELLDEAGFEPPTRFFASLFWGAWLTRKVQ
ncbi:class I SAM-dependent methyltransferase [Microvirga puerhi]|uniref:Class I SAM-dependent methyltransferase n=1 Tax=Microvirga puerhi TaxID=2876078 RepID=A0ABS7VL45_9HYPH|nr:class I SAM-dependent methyltransferase [Microvirga puerhi]MBZ6076214.1 class I SAM-dependent methyltransferase [Microvirga puerhi]